MDNIELKFEEINYVFPLIFVEGTNDKPYLFGTGNDQREITINHFFISEFTVTQILYEHIMGTNPALYSNKALPDYAGIQRSMY